MNKLFKKTVPAAFALALATVGLAGCSGGADAPAVPSVHEDSLVVAVQKTKNVPDYNLTFVETYIKDVQEGHGQFNAVIIDGKPYLAVDSAVQLGSDKGNRTNRENENQAQRKNVKALIAKYVAKTSEVDVIEGLALADRVHASAKDGKGTTVIASSGLSTTGVLDLSGKGMLSVESDAVVSHLKKYGLELDHTQRVIWYGLADVADDQASLTPALRKSLQNVYSAALKELGVDEVIFVEDAIAASAQKPAELPEVRAIDVPAMEPLKATVNEEVKLSSETLPFVAGTASFVDPDAARQVVAPFAEALAADPGLTCTVAGSTAGYPWDPQYAMDLGLERAQAVKDLLVAAGIDSGRIDAISYGDAAPGHVPDIGSDGYQLIDKAQQNRWCSVTLKR